MNIQKKMPHVLRNAEVWEKDKILNKKVQTV